MCGEIIPEGRMICERCENPGVDTEIIKLTVSLNKVCDILKFISLTSKCKCDVIAKSGHFTVDAKSLLGLYSLNLTNPVVVEFYGTVPHEVILGMKKFVVE